MEDHGESAHCNGHGVGRSTRRLLHRICNAALRSADYDGIAKPQRWFAVGMMGGSVTMVP